MGYYTRSTSTVLLSPLSLLDRVVWRHLARASNSLLEAVDDDDDDLMFNDASTHRVICV